MFVTNKYGLDSIVTSETTIYTLSIVVPIVKEEVNKSKTNDTALS